MRWKGGSAMALAIALVVACNSPTPSPSAIPSPATSAAPSAAPSADAAPSASPAIVPTASGPLASSGSIAVLAADGSISIVGPDGATTPFADTTDGQYGFPTWSPDGSHLAAVRSDGTQTSVVVFEAAGASSAPAEPTVIFEKPGASPFYLYWTPDGERVSFLVTEDDVLSLRLAPADGSAPVDGSGAGAVVRTGNPFYYDWLAADRLFAHIGTGAEGFLGEIGLDGDEARPGFEAPGDFRSGVVAPDQRTVAFVRGAIGGPGEVVISGIDGSNEHSMVVYGQTAVVFDPGGGSVASIGSSEPDDVAGFPLGPLKLLDAASGEVRTLIDGAVVSFWWSPDGSTIAALRVQPAIGSSTAASGPSQEPTNEVRLLFVDVASGRTLSQPVVLPSERFISALLAYFDQYALSHRLWAPDGSAFLLPEVGADGVTRIVARHPDGSAPVSLAGEIAFWSP